MYSFFFYSKIISMQTRRYKIQFQRVKCSRACLILFFNLLNILKRVGVAINPNATWKNVLG